MSSFEDELSCSALPSAHTMLQSTKLWTVVLPWEAKASYQCPWSSFRKQGNIFTLYLAIKHAVKKTSGLDSMTTSTPVILTMYNIKISVSKNLAEFIPLTANIPDMTVNECKQIKMGKDETTTLGILRLRFNMNDPTYKDLKEFLDDGKAPDVPFAVTVHPKVPSA